MRTKKIFGAILLTFILTMMCGMATMAARPGNATNVAQTNATTTTVSFAWAGGSGAIGYNVYDYNSGVKITSTNTTSVSIGGLAPDTRYRYYIKSVNRSGEESYGAYAYGTTVAGGVTGITPTSSGKKAIYVIWDAKVNQDGYEVEAYAYNGKTVVARADVRYRSATLENLTEKKFYRVRIRPYVKMTNGSRCYGAWQEIQTSNNKNLKLKQSGAKMKVSWSKVAGVTSYTIYGRKGSSSDRNTYKKIKTLKASAKSYTVTKIKGKKLKRGSSYYFFVVANRKVNGKTYQSIVSSSMGMYMSRYR